MVSGYVSFQSFLSSFFVWCEKVVQFGSFAWFRFPSTITEEAA